VVDRDIARDCEKPGLQRTAGLISVARLIDRQEDVLVDILDFARVCDAISQKLHHRRSDIVQQGTASIAVPPLQAFHQMRA
jgi:hypothetical protein